MATLMLEGGADIRYIQQMLGHATSTARRFTPRCSIRKLKQIHAATHPGAKLEHRSQAECQRAARVRTTEGRIAGTIWPSEEGEDENE